MNTCKVCGELTDNIAYCDECVFQVREFVQGVTWEISQWLNTDEDTALELLGIAQLEETRRR